MLDLFYQIAFRIAYRLLRITWTIWHPHTTGAFVALWHKGELLLVRHSYKPGICLPGGGVQKGESYIEAAKRELREETGIDIEAAQLEEPLVVHLTDEGKDDHVCCFEVNYAGSMPDIAIDNREIVWAAFIDPTTLQPDACNTLLRAYLQHRSSSSN